MVLLMDQVADGAPECHTMTHQERERPGRWHQRSFTVTDGQTLDSAHNPKVAGSNPAPATKKALVSHYGGPGLRRSEGRALMVLLMVRGGHGRRDGASRGASRTGPAATGDLKGVRPGCTWPVTCSPGSRVVDVAARGPGTSTMRSLERVYAGVVGRLPQRSRTRP